MNWWRPSLLLLGGLWVAAGCSESRELPHGGPFASGDRVPTSDVVIECKPARASEHLQPRAELMAMGVPTSGGPQLVYTSDLFARFSSVCGGCHVEASSGGKNVNKTNFASVVDETWLAVIKSDDPAKFMPPPPNGKPFSSRTGNDPLLELVRYLEAWFAAGRPAKAFSLDGGGGAPMADYGFAPEVGQAMTNLGNCVPDPGMVANSESGVMESLDTFFADAKELPPTLAETDLTTFDSETLAQTGVVAFVPGYPLWSAGSGKLRHIRVPRGTSVRFDKEKQTFEIPPNTRFYKTFFRKIVDRAGRVSHRKMETRLIVARPDRVNADGVTETTALFGTYVWSEDESTARLGNLPYRDGTMFADQVRTYITNELEYQLLADAVPAGADFEGKLAEAVAETPGLEMHYAIPGSIRCVQCHMGSPTKDFVLGFFPLQVARRESGTGGAYEETGADELNQLQRLIDYGVISGMASPADVTTLEESQTPRKARTRGELQAQAYMLGNCAHCHNPRGFPSVSKPELTEVLNFMPDHRSGGVFEFPLDRTSPVRFRGANGNIPMPYITPSVTDYPVTDSLGNRIDNGSPAGLSYTQKRALNGLDCATPDSDTNAAEVRPFCGKRRSGPAYVYAPWRSLIYRNVDTPFNYFDDYVPFPHMPMHTPGFDCRAPRIMGDWMVSLPAVRKVIPALADEDLPEGNDVINHRKLGTSRKFVVYDDTPQPFVSVAPEDSAYSDATIAARKRLTDYHDGVRYDYCEEKLSPDIYDPIAVYTLGNNYRPDANRYTGVSPPPNDPSGEYFAGLPIPIGPAIGVPFHSHFFPYDPTDTPPPWAPRRPEWKGILVERHPDTSLPVGVPVPSDDEKKAEFARRQKALADALNEATLTADLQKYATTEIPIGLWKEKPACAATLAKKPKVESFTGDAKPSWMEGKAPGAPVFMASPGAFLYRSICFNCHGPRADGRGLQADALAASSEGEARPANFRNGLFGPMASLGENFRREFGGGNLDVARNWASRYVAWMALGGTLKRIPADIIHQVEATTIFGQSRPNLNQLPGAGEVSGNMLNLAKGICSIILPNPSNNYGFNHEGDLKAFEGGGLALTYPPFNSDKTPFLSSNGDRDLWMHLCTQYSPIVVRVYELINKTDILLSSMYYVEDDAPYPADAPVLDHERRVVQGVRKDNLYPACYRVPANAGEASIIASSKVITTLKMPPCPDSFLSKARPLWRRNPSVEDAKIYDMNQYRWELRGAIATGMTVFSYLETGTQFNTPPPSYDECQLLK